MATRVKKPLKKTASKKERAATAAPRSFWLGAWMEFLKVTTEELADRVNVDRTSIWRYETGERQPRKGMIAKIATALGLEPADLWRPPGLLDLNQAAVHITDNADRQRLADFIRNWRP